MPIRSSVLEPLMKSLLILLSTFLSLALVGCKEGTIVYDIDFPRADSDEAQPKRIAPASVSLLAASPNLAENAGSVLVSATLNKTASSATTVLLSLSGSATLNIDYSTDNTSTPARLLLRVLGLRMEATRSSRKPQKSFKRI